MHSRGITWFYGPLLLALSLALMACGQGRQSSAACTRAEARALPTEAVPLVDLSPSFFRARSPEAMDTFLQAHPALSTHFFEQHRYPASQRLSLGLSQLVANPYIDSLYQDVRLHYGDLSALHAQLAVAWGSLQAYDTAFVPPRIQTLISGLYRDLYLSDSLVIVSLDYFIGETARYKPQGLPLYLLRRYSPQHVVPTLMFYISERYNQSDLSDNTLLSDMIAMGKTYAFTQSMLPCVPDSVLLGYTEEQMQAVHENQDIIWDYFLHNQLLYETNPQVRQKFVGERPKVYEISEACPGRVGHWLGWQIVRAYLGQQSESGQQPLRALMAERDAKKILSLSRYSPEK